MGRQHPLDVFRSSRDGFDKASKRRTVAGKVIASSVKVKSKLSGSSRGGSGARPKPLGSAKPTARATAASGKASTKTAGKAASRPSAKSPGKTPSRISRMASGTKLFAPGPGGKRRSGAARSADGATRTIFFSAIVMLSAVVLALVFKQFWLGEGMADLPTMKLGDVIPEGPGQPLDPSDTAAGGPVPAEATPDWFTIRAAVYNASPRGVELASAAHDELVLRGLPDVKLIGHLPSDPEAAEAGEFESVELIVGSARTAQALEGTLDRLLAINDWAGGKAAPFVDAGIVPHPVPPASDED